MADMLSDAAEWLVDELADNVSQTVTYTRGGLSVSLTATKCPVRSDLDPTFGLLRVGECDWIIKASLLVLNEETVTPQHTSDTIEEADGTQWMVQPTGAEDCYRPLDPYKTAWRIHTKRIIDG